jgi:hypothetical protein
MPEKNDSGTQPLKSLQYKGVYSIDTLFVQNRSTLSRPEKTIQVSE